MPNRSNRQNGGWSGDWTAIHDDSPSCKSMLEISTAARIGLLDWNKRFRWVDGNYPYAVATYEALLLIGKPMLSLGL